MKVLIVDDSGVMRRVLGRELVAVGFQQENLSEAADGEESLKMVAENTYDLITMDWNMPNLLGIDAVREMRARGITTPILMVTTEAEKSNVVTAIQAGANNYLIKPFTKDDLQDKVKQLLGPRLAELEVHAPVPDLGQQVVDVASGRISSH